MSVLNEVLAANQAYVAEFGVKVTLRFHLLEALQS